MSGSLTPCQREREREREREGEGGGREGVRDREGKVTDKESEAEI